MYDTRLHYRAIHGMDGIGQMPANCMPGFVGPLSPAEKAVCDSYGSGESGAPEGTAAPGGAPGDYAGETSNPTPIPTVTGAGISPNTLLIVGAAGLAILFGISYMNR